MTLVGVSGAVLNLLSHLTSIVMLMVAAFSIRLVDAFARTAVNILQYVTGAVVERDGIQFHRQREHMEPVYESNLNITDPPQFIDEKASLDKSDFPFTAEELIEKTKKLLSPDVELGTKQPDLLAGDFQFVFPVVGPLDKQEFCTIFGGFKVREAFPESKSNYFGFTVDPLEPNRVWFFSRAEVVHKGTLKFGSLKLTPTGRKVVATPQVFSMTFDREGRCYKLTGGYSVDRTVGNCDGLGGMFGLIHALGGNLPFPEGKPWKPSLEWEAMVKRVAEVHKEWQKITG